MKHIITSLVLLLLSCVSYAVVREAKLVFIDKRILRVTDVKTGDTVEKIIRITNAGDMDLLITNYKASCNCTTAELPQILKPGQIDSIILKTDTKGKLGRNTITVLFETNTVQKDYVIRMDLDVIR